MLSHELEFCCNPGLLTRVFIDHTFAFTMAGIYKYCPKIVKEFCISNQPKNTILKLLAEGASWLNLSMQSMPVTNPGAISSHNFVLLFPQTLHQFCQKVFAPGAADETLPLKRSNSDALCGDGQVLIFQITTFYIEVQGMQLIAQKRRKRTNYAKVPSTCWSWQFHGRSNSQAGRRRGEFKDWWQYEE